MEKITKHKRQEKPDIRMDLSSKILEIFKKTEKPLVIKDQGITFYRFHYKDVFNLTIDFMQKNDLGSELLSVKMIDKNILHLVDTKEKLENFSNELCNHITFLTENFKLIEIDKENNKAQIRSYPPFVKHNEKLFFEIIINANEPSIYLCRKLNDTRKHITKPVSFVVTDEILQRLLKHFTHHGNAN